VIASDVEPVLAQPVNWKSACARARWARWDCLGAQGGEGWVFG